MPTVTLVHAVLPALAPMEKALADALPDVRVRHLLDEGLSSEAERRGGVERTCIERMLTLLGLVVAAPTDAILLTCTAYSTMLPEARERYPGTPLYAVDQVMVETAVARASRIGVLATFAAGLEQQRELLAREADAQGKTIEIVASLHPAAMQALRAGDGAEHDRIVLAALPALAAQTEIVLLAQVSMARVLPIGRFRGSTKIAGGKDAAFGWFRAALDELLPLAAEFKVRIVLEPHTRYIGDMLTTIAQTIDFIRTFESPWLVYEADFHHQALEEQSLIASLVEGVRSGLMTYVQVADSNRGVPGSGSFNWVDLLATLKATGYNGWIAVECRQDPDSDHCAQQAFATLHGVLHNLHT